MKWRHVILILAGVAAVIWRARYDPFPRPGDNPALDLIAVHDPAFHAVIQAWYSVAPGVAVLLTGLISLSVWRVWFQTDRRRTDRGTLPTWPISPADPAPSVVVGEVHHPVEPQETAHPSWLVIPERGLYTGVLIFGAVGSGKTSACMHPFAQQILSWRADDPSAGRRLWCWKSRAISATPSTRSSRRADGRGTIWRLVWRVRWQWNPLDDPHLDSYSLAYTISTLLNQLFGKSREPFWQQAYTNLVRWIIELYRLLPERWVTLRDVYRCTIDADLFAAKIQEAETRAAQISQAKITISCRDLFAQKSRLTEWDWQIDRDADQATCVQTSALQDRLAEIGVSSTTERVQDGAGSDLRERVEAIGRWYRNDWMALDNKLRSSIVEGISVFLSLFDLPDVAAIFCPGPPKSSEAASRSSGKTDAREEDSPDAPASASIPGCAKDCPPWPS